MKTIKDIVKDIESGTVDESNANGQGVIIVDSIEDFMRRHGATHLKDLDKSLGKKGKD